MNCVLLALERVVVQLVLLGPEPGRIQKLTPTCDALFVPDIDQALDDEDRKREFWAAFRALGDWYSAFPPY